MLTYIQIISLSETLWVVSFFMFSDSPTKGSKYRRQRAENKSINETAEEETTSQKCRQKTDTQTSKIVICYLSYLYLLTMSLTWCNTHTNTLGAGDSGAFLPVTCYHIRCILRSGVTSSKSTDLEVPRNSRIF